MVLLLKPLYPKCVNWVCTGMTCMMILYMKMNIFLNVFDGVKCTLGFPKVSLDLDLPELSFLPVWVYQHVLTWSQVHL